MGMWKEGSARYLVTRRVSAAIVSNEDRYRCFIYERAKPREEGLLDYRLAESAEATCSGLFSTSDGYRRLQLELVGSYNKCQFPPWTTVHRRWHSLDRRVSYQFNRKNTSLTMFSPDNETRMECAEIVDVSTRETLLVVRATTGCDSGFRCVALYRRDGHVMEAQFGNVTQLPEQACRSDFPRDTADFHTVVASSPRHVACPHLGQYSVTGLTLNRRSGRGPDDRDVRDLAAAGGDFRSLHMGCQSHDMMVLSGHVGVPRAFSCQGSWQDNNTFYLVASPSSSGSSWGSSRHFCFVYTVSAEGLRFSTVSRSCPRAVRPGVEGMLAFNVTARAECLTSGAEPPLSPLSPRLLALSALAVVAARWR